MTYFIYLFIILMLTAVDQYVKTVVASYMTLGQSIELIPDFFNLTYVLNDGAGFSILRGETQLFIGITVAALAIFGWFLYRTDKKDYLSVCSFLLIIGGTIGNFIDRINNGLVVDFLDFYIFGYDFPIFNVADIYLTIGVFIMILSTLREGKNGTD